MRLFKEGDRSSGICETCRCKVATRMEYRDFKEEGWEDLVPGVLVSVCETCGNVVGIPPQSTPRINEFHGSADSSREAVEARVPRVLTEALDLVASTIGGDSKVVRPAIVRYYLNEVGRNEQFAALVKKASGNQLASGKAEGRVSLKVVSHRWRKASLKAQEAGLTNNAELIRGVLSMVADDFGISPCPCGDEAVSMDPKGAKGRVAFLKDMAMTV